MPDVAVAHSDQNDRSKIRTEKVDGNVIEMLRRDFPI